MKDDQNMQEQPQEQDGFIPRDMGPLPWFVTNYPDYPTIRAEATHACGVAWKLMAYCATEKNGGIIRNCRKWGARKWLKEAGLSQKPGKKSSFFVWKNDDLHITCYDAEKEAKALRNSEMQQYKAWLRHHGKGNAAACPPACADKDEDEDEDEDISIGEVAASSNEKQCSIGAAAPQAPPAAPPAPAASTPPPPAYPSAVEDVLPWFKHYAPALPEDEQRQVAEGWFQEKRQTGWIDEEGKQIGNWMLMAKRYAETCNNNALHAEQAQQQIHELREKSKEEEAAQYVTKAGRLTRPKDAPSAEEVANELECYRYADNLSKDELIANAHIFLSWMDSKNWKTGSAPVKQWKKCVPGFIDWKIEKARKGQGQ